MPSGSIYALFVFFVAKWGFKDPVGVELARSREGAGQKSQLRITRMARMGSGICSHRESRRFTEETITRYVLHPDLSLRSLRRKGFPEAGEDLLWTPDLAFPDHQNLPAQAAQAVSVLHSYQKESYSMLSCFWRL